VALARRSQRVTRLLVTSLVMLSLVTITLDYREGATGPFETMGRALFSVVAPMQDAVSHMFRPIGSFFSGLAHVGSLESENRRLRAQVKDLQTRNGQVVTLQQQLQAAEALIQIKERLNLTNSIGANVIASSVSNFQWTITVDRGSSDGVQVNDPVVASAGLVGRVIGPIASCCATVRLIIDPKSAVAARLAATGETGLIVGQRNEPLQMQLVSAEAEVPAGEEVVTSGYQGGLFPPGIPVGTVSHVYDDPGSLSKVIQIRPSVDFSSLEFVLVVLGPGS
jgi:rod shape-determining protein MreC